MTDKPSLPSLWKTQNWPGMFGSLHDEIDRVFHDFTQSVGLTPGRTNGNALMSPVINVAETDKALEITAELPGVDQEDVNVTVTDNRLTILAEKKAEEEDKSKDYHVVERSYGRFTRSMSLPFGVDPDKVDAQFKNGILTVVLPKPPEVTAKTHKVKIKDAA
ncbi:MAG: Hsp20/alpha crystallin family protein [Pseudomonadota bacterium]